METASKSSEEMGMEQVALSKVETCKREAQTLAERASAVVIVDDRTHELAGQMLGQIKREVKDIEQWFKPLTEAANKLHKNLTRLRGEAIAPYQAADAVLRTAWIDYERKREAERRAEEERLRAEAQKKLEEEARRAQAAEQKRLEEEALRKAEETGDETILENVPKAEIVIPEAPPVTIDRPKQAGISISENWDIEIVDEAQIPREYMIPDEKRLRNLAKGLKDKMNIPGIRAYNKGGMSVRA